MNTTSSGYGDARVGIATRDDRRKGLNPYEDQEEVASLVREAIREGGLGVTDPRRPLMDVIPRGSTVLLKPNWVLHENQSGGSMDCMITHPSIIMAALGEVVQAGAGRVIIADAPIQSADFDALATPALRKAVARAAGSTQVEVVDLRNVISQVRGGSLHAVRTPRGDDRSVLFDLGVESLLEPVSSPDGRFRVTNYDPDHMASVHGRGLHRYLVCREPFEADVIINIPKLKTHGKAGVTAALKNVVGLNADKSYLPHHRTGDPRSGGDCYPIQSRFKRVGERFLDEANRHIGTPAYARWVRASALANRVKGGDLEGKWYGNDTTWRMALDLNKILLYGNPDGALSPTPLRHYSLTDAVVAGDGNGPLSPEDRYLGAVTFSASSPHADLVHCALMLFNWQRIPVVREAFGESSLRLMEAGPNAAEARHRGKNISLDDLGAELGVPFRAPDGWAGEIEIEGRTDVAVAVSDRDNQDG